MSGGLTYRRSYVNLSLAKTTGPETLSKDNKTKDDKVSERYFHLF